MKRKHKSYSKPRRPFDKARIDEEAEIKTEFGLKNKKEIWKADAKINKIREKAKKLISATETEQKEFFNRLNKVGLKVDSIAEVLSLDKKDFLNRRLQTVLVNKKLATTSKQARQFITHKKVLVDGKALDSPSYVVPVNLEGKIKLKAKKKKAVKKEQPVEKPAEKVPKEETPVEEVSQEKPIEQPKEEKPVEEVKEEKAEKKVEEKSVEQPEAPKEEVKPEEKQNE